MPEQRIHDAIDFFDKLFSEGLPRNASLEVIEAYDIWTKLKDDDVTIKSKIAKLEELENQYRRATNPIQKAEIQEQIYRTKEEIKELEKQKEERKKLLKNKLESIFNEITSHGT